VSKNQHIAARSASHGQPIEQGVVLPGPVSRNDSNPIDKTTSLRAALALHAPNTSFLAFSTNPSSSETNRSAARAAVLRPVIGEPWKKAHCG